MLFYTKRMVSAYGGILFLVFYTSGCASVSVQSMRQAKGRFYAPSRIYIQSYAFHQEKLAVDRSGKELQKFQKVLENELSCALQKQIQKKLVECHILSEGTKPPKGPYWLITGHFDQVQQGSRILRALFGFGLGKTKIKVTTSVYSLSERIPRLIYTIKTTGTSGHMPGALPSVAMAPAGMVLAPAGLLGGAASGTLQSGTSGLSFDVRRTAREITAALSQYLYKHGALSKNRRIRVKRAGAWF